MNLLAALEETCKGAFERVSAGVASEKNNKWVVLAGSVAVATVLFWVGRSKRRRRGHLKRNVSYTSLGLALGSFPIDTQVPDATINTACYFDNLPSNEEIVEQIVQPLLSYERFSKILDLNSESFRHAKEDYQAKDLIREIVINTNNIDVVHRTIFEHLQDPLRDRAGSNNKDLPWWEILIIRNTSSNQKKGDGATSACVLRVHHALADGVALVHAFQKILKTRDGNPLPSTLDKLLKPPVRKHHPNFLSKVLSLLEATWHVLTLGISKYDDDTCFSKHNHSKLSYSGKRNVLEFPTVPLDFVKELKSAANVTVNDILMTAVSQAIHDYCMSRNDPIIRSRDVSITSNGGVNVVNNNTTQQKDVDPSSIQCRALLPVGFPRSPDELQDTSTAMRNKWCLASCDLGVGPNDVLDRLWKIREKTTEMKETPRAFMQLQIQNFLPKILPHSITRQAVHDVFSRHSLVLTNVPGPEQVCLFAGQPVKSVQLFFCNLLTQVDLLSYAGQVSGNIIYDDDALPEMQDFGRYYGSALLDLAERLQVTPPASLVSAMDESES